jgi:hypothetical protein
MKLSPVIAKWLLNKESSDAIGIAFLPFHKSVHCKVAERYTAADKKISLIFVVITRQVLGDFTILFLEHLK